MTETLKPVPCPVCGQPAKTVAIPTGVLCGCAELFCPGPAPCKAETWDEAVKAWNTAVAKFPKPNRPPQPQTAAPQPQTAAPQLTDNPEAFTALLVAMLRQIKAACDVRFDMDDNGSPCRGCPAEAACQKVESTTHREPWEWDLDEPEKGGTGDGVED